MTMTSDDIDQIVRRVRPDLKRSADALVSMASTLDRTVGAMDVHAQQGEAREQRVVELVTVVRVEVAALRGLVEGMQTHHTPATKAGEAREELEEESLSLLSGIVRGVRLAPARLARQAGEVFALARAYPKLSTLIAVGAAGYIRELAVLMPGLAPVASFLEALVTLVKSAAGMVP